MPRYPLLISFIFFFFDGDAQQKENTGINFKLSCGFAAINSAEVNHVQQSGKFKNYTLLKQNLFSSNKAEAVLSAILLQELVAKQLTDLTTDERNRINKISSWTDKYSICYTCTGHFEGKIKNLLADRINPEYILISETLQKTD